MVRKYYNRVLTFTNKNKKKIKWIITLYFSIKMVCAPDRLKIKKKNNEKTKKYKNKHAFIESS